MHCLILRGAGGTVIRRFAPDTRLNGRGFTDAELVPGDRLGIGPLEFEVLDAGRLPEPPPAQAPQSRETQSTEPVPERRMLDELAARVASANRQGRTRARRLIDQLRSARREIARLQQQKEENADEPRRVRAQEDQLDQRRSELNARAAQLDQREKDLNKKEEILNEHEKAVSHKEEVLNERQTALDQHATELDARAEELDRQQAELETRQTELDAYQVELDTLRAELDARESEGQSARQEDIRFEGPSDKSPKSPGSSEEVLRRMGILVSSSDEEADDQRPASPGPTQSGTAETPGSLDEPDGDEDESIDDYMARLLERVRETPARSGAPVASPSSSVRAGARSSAPPSGPAPTDSPQPASPTAEPPQPAEISPRATAPEKSVDLSAMRELANLSAHAAISRHARRMLLGTVASKLAVAIVALATAAILGWLWWTRWPESLVLCAAAASFVVALIWGVQYVLLTGLMVFRKSGRADWKHRSDEQTAASRQAAAHDCSVPESCDSA